MIYIESLKEYVGVISEEELKKISTKIYMLTDFICDDYPEYREWYFTKQLPNTIYTNERNILFVRNPKDNNEIISMACLKRNNEEQKICTLFVSSKFRSLGIGKAIVEESMKWLGTSTPLITFADYKLEMFRSFINKYNWKLEEMVQGLHNDGSYELCFNGMLTKNNNETLKQQLHKKLTMALENRYRQLIK